MKLTEARKLLEREKGKRLALAEHIKDLKQDVKTNKRYLEFLREAVTIIRMVSLETQQALQYHISDITSLALESIFTEPYKLVLQFVERRNKTECDILFERNGEQFSPMDSSGGGTVDVASFALRIASWSMSQQRTRPVIILDEPLRFLSADKQENASQMIKEISEKLGIQFIIVTHEPVLASYANRTFEVKIKNGVTKITES